jgi:L-lactate dehydrogenase complex protein LldE
MKVALFVPCYVDQLYPDVGLATVDVLERLGVAVDFPESQTCCGQPMANSGCSGAARPLATRFVEIFAGYDHVVSPSGSCVSMVRHHYDDFFGKDDARAREVRSRTLELTEFLVGVLGVERIAGTFPYRVGVHQSCHGLRELRLGIASELVPLRRGAIPQVPAPTDVPGGAIAGLLSGLDGAEVVLPSRPDECCGFGGTFAVAEEAVSCMMGNDRVADHAQAGAEVLTAGDMSCLMHLEGLIRRQGHPMAVMHIAQILAGRQPAIAARQPAADAPVRAVAGS